MCIIGRGNKSMIPIIVISVVALVIAIVAYQIVVQKFYWGPKGPPREDEQKKKGR